MQPVTDAARRGNRHPVATAFAWAVGVIATGFTGFLIFLAVTVAGEWSGYEGGMGGAALAILGFVAFLTLIAWTITFMLFRISRH